MRVDELARLYEAKTDDELVRLAADSSQLTPEAQTALASELARRRLHTGNTLTALPDGNEGGLAQPRARARSFSDSLGVGVFVASVLRLYHSHLWLFVKLMAPAVVAGWAAIFISRHEGREIARHLPRGDELLRHKTEILEMWLVNTAGFLGSWVAFSFSFGAICSVVRQVHSGAVPSIAEALLDLRQCLGSFLRLSVLLFALCLVAFGASMILDAGLIWLSLRYVHLDGYAIWTLSFVTTGLALLVLSRFALAVPAVVLDHYRVGRAIFRSDELTEGKWLTLAALLAKSLIGGYVASLCPYWLASWLLSDVPLPHWFPWILTVASIAAVTVVEPPMFIGFAQLYLEKSTQPRASEAFATQLA